MPAQLSFQFRPSKFLAVYLLFIFFIFFIPLLLAPLSLLIAVVLSVLLLIYGGFVFNKQFLHFTDYQITGLDFVDPGWQLCVNGEVVSVLLLNSQVWPFLLTATFQCSVTNRKYQLFTLKDSCDADSFRRLSILLRSSKSYTKLTD